jgi:tetratricopeptide (TPR) repeat protein
MGFIKNILKNESQDPDFWYRKGRELCASGYYLDALEALDKMIAKSAYHADSWFLKGYALYQMGKYEESLQFFDQALIFNPQLHEALTYKGLIYSGIGRHSEALTHYDRALAINPRYGKAWYVKGLTLAILERYDEAISAYEQVLSAEPKHVDALAGISFAMKKRERSRVTKPVEKSVDLTSMPQQNIPNSVTTEDSADRSGPVGMLPSANTASPPNLPRTSVAATLREKATHDLFQEVSVLHRDPSNSSGTTVRNTGKTVSVPANQFDTSPHENAGVTPNSPTPIRLNSYEELIQQTRDLLEATPEDCSFLISLGDLYIKVGQYQQATEAYEHVLELDPENARTWAALGDARRKLGIYDEAQFAYDQALEINKDDISTWINRGKALTMLGRYEEAIKSCDCAIERDYDNIDAWLYKGFLLKKIQRHSDALNAYDHVLMINPEHDQAMRQRRTLIDSM